MEVRVLSSALFSVQGLAASGRKSLYFLYRGWGQRFAAHLLRRHLPDTIFDGVRKIFGPIKDSLSGGCEDDFTVA